jgi:hypothetical protein
MVCGARDIEAIAGAMRALMDDAVRANASRRARAAVAALTPAAMASELLALYGALLPS